MKKMKHNKKRNTAFIYETLTRELTQAIVEKNAARKNKTISPIVSYFKYFKFFHFLKPQSLCANF